MTTLETMDQSKATDAPAVESHPKTSPWLFIATLYIPFGLLNGMMQQLPYNLFKLLGFSNQVVGMLSGIGLVISLRFLYAPWLDGITTKRRLSLATLALSGGLMVLVAVLIYLQPSQSLFLAGMVLALVIMAFLSGSHETAADGYYIRVLDPKEQAQFIGIKTAAIRFGTISAVMGLMWSATKIAAARGSVDMNSLDRSGFYVGFALAYGIAALVMFGCTVINKYKVPIIAQDEPVKHEGFAFSEILKEYFRQKRIVLVLIVILFYRLGQGFLLMRNPFLLDPVSDGGMAVPATTIPLYGILTDTPWMIIGGVLGGYVLKWYGIRRTFIPLALFMSLPNLFYAWLAWARPEGYVVLFGEQLNTAMLIGSSFESLGYGLSFSAIFYYMHIMATEAGRNKTAILAVSLCFMNIGFSLPCMMSGYVQGWLGYVWLFLLSALVGLAVLIAIPFLPMPKTETQSGSS